MRELSKDSLNCVKYNFDLMNVGNENFLLIYRVKICEFKNIFYYGIKEETKIV